MLFNAAHGQKSVSRLKKDTLTDVTRTLAQSAADSRRVCPTPHEVRGKKKAAAVCSAAVHSKQFIEVTGPRRPKPKTRCSSWRPWFVWEISSYQIYRLSLPEIRCAHRPRTHPLAQCAGVPTCSAAGAVVKPPTQMCESEHLPYPAPMPDERSRTNKNKRNPSFV